MMPMNMVDAEPLLVPVKTEPGTYPTATSKLRAPYITQPVNRLLQATKQVPVRKQMQDAFAKSTEAGSAGCRPSDQSVVVDMRDLRVCESLMGRTCVATLTPELQAALKAQIGDVPGGALYLTGVHVERTMNVSLS